MAKNNNPGRILKGTKSQPSLKGASGVWTLDEALQYHRANQWPQPNLFQPVANSLRFKKNSSATIPYISRTPGRAGNLLKWTVSAWVKLGSIGTAARMELFSAGDTASSTTPANMSLMINWQGYSQDWHVAFLTGGGTYQIQTNLVLRDPAAWYHIVVAYDAAQSTNTNRVQIYINGVLASWSSTNPTGGGATYTPQNLPLNWNNAGQVQRIGSGYDGGETYFLDGYLSEFYNIDGQALTPTMFGQFDTNNTWVPIPYTGSYGTNGFYLPFTNPTTSQTLGYDASLNGTATYGADQDPYRGSVALHLTGNGPAGGQNNTFADSSSNNLSFTRNGSATQGSFSPFSKDSTTSYNPAIHGASAYFNGSTDYIYTASNALFNVGSNNVTIEAWVYLTAFNQGASPYISTIWSLDGSGTNNTFLYIYRTGSIAVGINGTNEIASASGVISLNNWYHTAVVRNGSTTTVYVNGVSVASNTTAVWAQTGSRPFYVGSNPQSAYYYLTGYIASVRFLTNTVLYTGAFTPTNRPFGTLTNNLLTWSEDFASSSYWTQYNGTSITSGSTIAPDGNPTGWLWTSATGAASFRGLFVTPALSSSVYTFSVYLKYKGVQWVALDLGGSSSFSSIDLLNGVTGTTASGRTTTINSVGNGWYRCTITSTSAIAGGQETGVWQLDANGGTTSIGSANNGFYIWGAQLEQASTASNYTPTPANYSTAPSLLLNFSNAAVIDSAAANNITTVGSATITSASKYGSGAVSLNGSSGNYLTTSSNTNLNFGTGDFTVEYWFNTSTASPQFIAFVQCAPAAGRYGVALGVFSATQLWYLFGDGSSWIFENKPTVSLSTYTWYHLAVTRNNTTVRLFLNGQLIDTMSNSTNLSQASNVSYAGGTPDGYVINGQIDDLRVTKGLARYTTSFTPPSRALPETGGKSFTTVNVNAGVVKSFTTTGTTSWTAPTDVTSVEVLVVAGGGGGGHGSSSGGGGGGGVIYNTQYPVTPGQTYTVTVGAGGAGTSGSVGGSGGNSIFGNLTAIGGGGAGAAGGSGGGAPNSSTYAGTAGQGFAGGQGYVDGSAYYRDGGGGGAGGVGGNSSTNSGSAGNGGAGGVGLQFGISGTPTYYAGGGGGGGWSRSGAPFPTPGAGGLGGGGAASPYNVDTPTAGSANTGGGGGASNNGAAGGSGIVLIRYTTTAVGNTSDTTTDNLVDSPTLYGHDMGMGGEVVGNYATFNPLSVNSGGTINSSALVNGNLQLSTATANTVATSTIGLPLVASGQFYAEFILTVSGGGSPLIGITTPNSQSLSGGSPSVCYRTNGQIQTNGSTTTTVATFTTGDLIAIAVDMTASGGQITFYKNSVSVATVTGLISQFAGAGNFINFGCQTNAASTTTFTANFGQRAWAYAPPQGFNALTTKNLPRPTSAAIAPNQYFDTVLYTGTGATQSITSLNFQPDFVWLKCRSTTYSFGLYDVIRGGLKELNSDSTAAENSSGSLTAFASNGFTLGTGNTGNASAATYVAWCWRAGSTPVSNTSGTITSQVSANTTSGFSVVTYTGNATNSQTVGHGLGATPSMIIWKNRDAATQWGVYHTSLGTSQYLVLNTNTGPAAYSGYTAVNSSTFQIANDSWFNGSTNKIVAYCWTQIPGFSQFGTYTGNGSTDGTFIYTGFKPAWIMIKNITTGGQGWNISDAARSPYNLVGNSLSPSSSQADNTGGSPSYSAMDFVSNGIKLRGTDAFTNGSANNYIYAVFAANPFGNTNGTAR